MLMCTDDYVRQLFVNQLSGPVPDSLGGLPSLLYLCARLWVRFCSLVV
jgi:hypothetical protein